MLLLLGATQRYLPLHYHDVIITALYHNDVMFISCGRLRSKTKTLDT